jgi:C4-dicarboxylate transporter DctM subunit
MIDVGQAVIGFFMMLGLMALGLHVAVAMLITSIVGVLVFMGSGPLESYGNQLWSIMNDFLLTSIPLFVLLGEILLRSGVTDRMYKTLSLWLSPLPGGLLHTNIGASSIFAAVSGSSVATAATISTVALPEFRKRKYNEKLVLGSIASGATLGILIPPSVNLIIFGALTNTSIGQLFVAGIIPGVCLTLLFMASIIIIAKMFPGVAEKSTEDVSMTDKVRSLVHLIPPAVVFFVTMGAIYFGWATPTEAAGAGVVLSLVIAAIYRGLSWKMLHDAFLSTMRTSALCLFIITAAFYLNFVIGVMGVPQAMTDYVASLGLSKLSLILVLIVFYLVLGCFIETLSMMVGTIPIVFPVILHANIDPVWFGIFLVLMMELALITPPVGMNLYVVQGIRGRGAVSDLFIGILPFVAVIGIFVAVIIAFPRLVTWLPSLMF